MLDVYKFSHTTTIEHSHVTLIRLKIIYTLHYNS